MTVQNISLADCRQLDRDLESAVETVCLTRAVAPDTTANIMKTATFIDHVFSSSTTAMVDPPCGSGKSLAVDAHILRCSRSWENPLRTISTDPAAPSPVYLVVDTLKTGQERLESLMSAGVAESTIGFYHAFWAEEHNRLTGENLTYEQFMASAGSRQQCNECPHRTTCRFGNRNAELRKGVVVMTHEGFIRLHEKRLIPADRDIIIDEEPALYFTTHIQRGELAAFVKHLDALGMVTPSCSRIREIAGELLGIIDDPSKHHATMAWESPVEHHIKTSAIRELEAISKVCGDDPKDSFQLPSSLALIFTLGYALVGGVHTFIYCDEKKIAIARDRISFDIPNRVLILNASAQISRYVYPDEMPVWTCTDLRGDYRHVTLHCLCGSLTKKHLSNGESIRNLIRYAKDKLGDADPVFLAVNKAKVDKNVEPTCQTDAKSLIVSEMPNIKESYVGYRGTIKGSNRWQNISKGIIAMSLFTDLSQYALSASLRTKREYSRDKLFTEDPQTGNRIPRFTKHRNLQDPNISAEFLRQAADDLYQTIMRLSCRRDRSTPVHVVLYVPNIDLLEYVYRLMPHVRIDSDDMTIAIADDLLSDNGPIPHAEMFSWLCLSKTSGKNISRIKRVAADFGWRCRRVKGKRGNNKEWVRQRDRLDTPAGQATSRQPLPPRKH